MVLCLHYEERIPHLKVRLSATFSWPSRNPYIGSFSANIPESRFLHCWKLLRNTTQTDWCQKNTHPQRLSQHIPRDSTVALSFWLRMKFHNIVYYSKTLLSPPVRLCIPALSQMVHLREKKGKIWGIHVGTLLWAKRRKRRPFSLFDFRMCISRR